MRISGGTILGLSLNFVTWIRDDGWPKGMPDNDNDQVQGSLQGEKSPRF
jgi:hypothetical protein